MSRGRGVRGREAAEREKERHGEGRREGENGGLDKGGGRGRAGRAGKWKRKRRSGQVSSPF